MQFELFISVSILIEEVDIRFVYLLKGIIELI